MCNKASRLLLVIICCFSLGSFAQNTTRSPYSRFGIGEMRSQSFVQHTLMGDNGISTRSARSFSISNPASYSGLIYTTLEAGGFVSGGKLSNNMQSVKVNSSSFSYFALGFPVIKRNTWGAAFGLLPYSSIGYDATQNVDSGALSYSNRYIGDGGLSRFFLGNSFRLYKSLHFGFNSSFVFGQVNSKKSTNFKDSMELTYGTRQVKSDYIRGFAFDFGLQYSHRLDSAKQRFLSAGVTYKLGSNLNLSRNIVSGSTYGGENIIDTSYRSETDEGKVYLPSGFAAGLSIQQADHWMISLNYEQTSWQEFKYLSEKNTLKTSQTFGIGGFIMPSDDDKLRPTGWNYFAKTKYYAGARYGISSIEVNKTRITETAFSAGFGFPTRSNAARIHVGAEYIMRGTTTAGLIREEYLRLNFAVTFNDLWFLKRKYD